VNDIIKIGSTVFVVQTNDIANLKNMPVINKRLISGTQNAAENFNHQQMAFGEEEKSNGGVFQVNQNS
jgi:hypothetical protein